MLAGLHLLQVIGSLLWMGVFVLLFPCFYRLMRSRATDFDVRALPSVLVAVTMVLGSMRWLFFPHVEDAMTTIEVLTRTGTVLLSIAAAGATLFVTNRLMHP